MSLSSPTASTGGIWSLLNANNNNNNKTNKKTSSGTNGNGSNSNDKGKGGAEVGMDEGAVKGNTSGPALQRLVVVGNSMSGKRTFIDRLQRAAAQIAAASTSSGPAAPHHGSGSGAGRAGGAAARAQQKATIAEERRAELTVGTIIPKSTSAAARGSGLYYNSVAYHNVGAELLECLADVTAAYPSSSLPDTTATKKAALAADSSASSTVTLTKLLSSPEEYSVVEEGTNDEEKDNTNTNTNESLTQGSSAAAANHLVIETIQKHSLNHNGHQQQQQHSLLAPAGSPSSCYHSYLVAAGQQQGGGTSGGARHTLTSSSTSSALPPSSSSSAAALSSPLFSQLLTLNNAVVEVIACDVAECLEAALPSYSSLERTAVVIVVDGMDIANSSSTIQYWSSMINDRVRTLCSSHANNTKEGPATATATGVVGAASSTKGSSSADPRVSAADVRSLASLRSLELASAKKAFKAVTSLVYANKSDGNMSNSIMGAGAGAGAGTSSSTVVIPQSLQILIPSMIVLTKTDLLEDACKNNSGILLQQQQQQQQQGNSGSNDSSSNGEQLFSSAIHHVRWLALQRGSAFLALSSTKQYTAEISGPMMPSSSVVGAAAVVSAAGGGGSTDLFASLWYYIVYGLLPNGLETFEFLQAKQNQLRQRLLRSVGGGATAAGGIDSLSAAAAEKSTTQSVDLQLSSNAYSAGRKGKSRTDGEGGGGEERRGGVSDGEEDADEEGADTYNNTGRSYTYGGGFSSASLAREQRKNALANHRRRVICEIISASIFNDPYIRPHILFFQPFAAASPFGANSSNNANTLVVPHTSSASAVFVPRGLDNPSFIERQAASSAYISVRFSSISTSGLSEIHKIVAESLSQPPPPPPSNSQSSSSSTSLSQQQQQQQLTSAEVTRKHYEIFAIQMSQELAVAANARGAAALSTASPPPPFQAMIDATAGAGSMSTNNGLLPNTQPPIGGGGGGNSVGSPNTPTPYQQQYNTNQHPSASALRVNGLLPTTVGGGGHAAGVDVTSSSSLPVSAAAEYATATLDSNNNNNEVRGGGADGDASGGDEAMIWDE